MAAHGILGKTDFEKKGKSKANWRREREVNEESWLGMLILVPLSSDSHVILKNHVKTDSYVVSRAVESPLPWCLIWEEGWSLVNWGWEI